MAIYILFIIEYPFFTSAVYKVKDILDGVPLLMMFPLNIIPMGLPGGDPHVLRAGHDYPVWRSKLPKGYIILDEVRIQFAGENDS